MADSFGHSHPKTVNAFFGAHHPRVGSLDHSEHEGAESDGAEESAVDVDTAALYLASRLGHGEQCRNEHQDADRKVHYEDPVPGSPLGQCAAGERADSRGTGDNRTPHPEGYCSVFAPEHGIHG